jgi:hypothetical protein
VFLASFYCCIQLALGGEIDVIYVALAFIKIVIIMMYKIKTLFANMNVLMCYLIAIHQDSAFKFLLKCS